MKNGDMPAAPAGEMVAMRLAQQGPSDDATYIANLHLASKGLTKRELFAAMAMQALVSSNDEGAGDRLVEVPEYAVQIADELLAALERPQ
jgi:hypothetical protein